MAHKPPTSRTGYAAQYILRPGGKTRLIGLSPEFSQALYHAVVAAFHAPFSRAGYQRAVNSVYAGFTPEQLWDNAPPEQRYVVGTKAPAAKGGVPDGVSMDELAKTAEYVADTGTMCVYCVPECLREEAEAGENPDDYAVPVPVKFIRERGFTVHGGVVYVDAPYDDDFGLLIDDKYYS